MLRLFKNQNGMNIVGQGGNILLFMLPALAAAVFAQLVFPQIAAFPEEMRVIQPLGYFLLVPGLILWASAVIQLLVEFPQGKLVTTGAYSIARNPIYASAALLIIPAVALLTFTWVYLVPSVFLYIGVMIFIGPEERQLARTFGKTYEDYHARVDRLVPFRRSGAAALESKTAIFVTKAVQAVRLRYAVAFVLLLMVIYVLGIHPWMVSWGSTPEEQQMTLPGDELHPKEAAHSTQAITIQAPPAVVWQWLAQVGQDRAGFYTYTWLENLLGVDIHNTDVIRPEWQQIAVGQDAWRMMPASYLGGVGEDSTRRVLISEPGRVLSLEMWGTYVLMPAESATRLIVRSEASAPTILSTMLVDPIVFTMGKRMLLGLQARAEGQPDTAAALAALAWLGFITTGIVTASQFLRQGWRAFWLVLPVLAALPALWMAQDAQSGLVAFTAVSIPILGFLTFGRSWWGPLLIISATALLALLLAPEAFSAFGLVFSMLLLAAVVSSILAAFAAGSKTCLTNS